jgi:hypothetical protein
MNANQISLVVHGFKDKDWLYRLVLINQNEQRRATARFDRAAYFKIHCLIKRNEILL